MTEQNFSRLDHAFARFMAKRCGLQKPEQEQFEHLMKKLSAMQLGGHSCLPVSDEEEYLLSSSSLVSATDATAFIVDNHCLYSQKYWVYETRLAHQLFSLSQHHYENADIHNICDRYFDAADKGNSQHQAALQAVSHALSIITGGPGTGKTTTVVKILAILQELNECKLHIALSAPTGKAAMRLQESINLSQQKLPASEHILQSIPNQVFTLHHILGALPPTPHFKHHAENPLPFDVLVVDEASMVDLPLMSKLVDALKPGGRLILLGDQNQLASVETGKVLNDLTQAFAEQTQRLNQTYRFSGPIKELAEWVNAQQAEPAWQLLKSNQENVDVLSGSALEFATDHYQAYWQLLNDNADHNALFEAFNQFRVLCANKHGEGSVNQINYHIESTLTQHHSAQTWYHGKPVMVTENNYALQLFNGDIGLCLQDGQRENQLSVFFQMPDGQIKRILPGRMPAHETAFAMTIHKSQGSEFSRLLIVMPDAFNPVLSKQLLYTAITRAKQHVTLSCSETIFKQTVSQSIYRHSGLADKINRLTT